MSASNMGVTAAANNNTSLTLDSKSKSGGRRRIVDVVEKKSNDEIHGEVGIGGTAGDGLMANGHAVRGDSVLDRTKELSQLRKGVIPSAVSPRRKKVLKHEKPKWETFLNVMMKNCLLLAALLWLGQTIYRWNHTMGGHDHSPLVPLDYEGWVSDIETSLKKTSKMLQVQLEVVDKKIGSEVERVKKELTNQIEENAVLFENELKKLEARTDGLDKSLSELKQMGLLSREEFMSFWDELKKSRSLDGSSNNFSLDEVRALAKAIVEKEIEMHTADGLGRVDYALASGGARVVRHSEPYVIGKVNTWLAVIKVAVAKVQNGVHDNAQKMLEPSFGEPGQCFALQGSTGFADIRLKTGIIPEAVTLEHVSKSVAYDRSSAPNNCRVFGWFKAPNTDVINQAERMSLLTEFQYDLKKSNAQTFNINSGDIGVINNVRFEFTSNHGNSALTCIYRFRVHGYEPSAALTVETKA